MDSAKLLELGFKKAGSELKEQETKKSKLAIAYEHYRYVRQEKIDKFNEQLKKQTIKRKGKKGVDLYESYDNLAFTDIEDYETVPPENVLADLKKAKEKDCFDTFEIGKIESVVEYKDPILFGRINGCSDRFYISQWDNDIRIEDILDDNEG